MIPRFVRRSFTTKSFLAEVTGGAKGLPRAGLYQSLVGKQMTKYYLRTACPGFFDGIDQDLPKGAMAALETVVASTTSEEYMEMLKEGSEPEWFRQWKLAVAENKEEFWKLNRINGAEVDTLFAIIGAQRGDKMKGKQFVELFGQHFVISPEFAEAIKTPDFRERATKCLPHLFADGAIVRARVLVNVDQSVKDGDKWIEQKKIDHLVTLEISLTPRGGKQAMLSAESILELTEDPMKPGNWQLADINFVLSDNYPVDPTDDDDTLKK